MKSPVFIFSLPRSGSTLLQRILMSHKDIASSAEPWILLPFLYATKSEGTLSEYAYVQSSMAVNDFIENLPNKNSDYEFLLKEFLLKVYTKQCKNNEKYFLDKTPRYYYIIDEIIKIFPDAKFIFLFRHPLNIFNSILSTWCNNELKRLYYYENDLNIGFKKLSDAYQKYESKSFRINYEELVINPEESTKKICNYLNINFDKAMITSFQSQETKGKMGDPTGIVKYNKITNESINSWSRSVKSTYRKKLLVKYISNIDSSYFTIQGYDKIEILADLANYNAPKYLSVKDFIDYNYSKLIKRFQLNLFFRKKIKSWLEENYIS